MLKEGTKRYNVRQFRALMGLPASWGVATFEPKDFEGLARLDGAGDALDDIERAVMDAIPPVVTLAGLLSAYDTLTAEFERALHEANARIGLRPSELGFAVAGFADACQAYAYALIGARAQGQALPSWEGVYGAWVAQSYRVANIPYLYDHQGQTWQVFMARTVYGRCGLVVHTASDVYDVEDAVYTCPAEHWMGRLLARLNTQLIERL